MRKAGSKELKPEEEEHLFKLKLELAEQEREERLLDTHIKWMKQVSSLVHLIPNWILGIPLVLLLMVGFFTGKNSGFRASKM